MIVPIKHILNENGVSEVFKLIVPEGIHAGSYVINKPEGWNQIDSIVDINDEFFNVQSFILGETTKLKFTEFGNPLAFKLIRDVYREYAGDGRIIFKWMAFKNGVEYDLLYENFEINLNKKPEQYDRTKMYIETELIKSEAQNKLYTRDDTTINLFDPKDLDDNDLPSIETFDIGFKKGDRTLTNFYTWDVSQVNTVFDMRKDQFFSFLRSSDYEFGDNTNEYCGYKNNPPNIRTDQGPFVQTNITLKKMKVEISNLHFFTKRLDNTFPDVTLFAITRNGGSIESKKTLKSSVPYSEAGENWGEIKIDNEIWDLDPLQPGQNLTFLVVTNQDVNFEIIAIDTNTSIKITCDMESPLVKTKGIRLIEALNHIAKNYTSGQISTQSNLLGFGGPYYNTSISTGLFLRGLDPIYLSEKIKTSLKSLLEDGAAKLLAMGYDVLNNKLTVEDIGYFFKDIKVYDLSSKIYIQEGFKIDHDKDLSFNNVQFGSTKYSTNVKFDITNFNTAVEVSTPIKSNKNKLDKQSNMIIDAYKIQELIEDKSSTTNNNDDDLVLIDMVEVNDYWDTGVFEGCRHTNVDNKLVLICASTPFSSTLMEIGHTIEITEGLNTGVWTILDIEDQRITLNKISGIQEGVNDTTIRYRIDSLIKNRTNEGFSDIGSSIRNPESTTNIRHNPKYQLARWFPFFGSGLRKKLNNELLKVTNYKNNSAAQMQIVSSDMANELQGIVVVGTNEELGRMRDYKQTFFNGEIIEITYTQVTFEEFLIIYNNWKFGEGNDRMKSRGYISCNTPYGIYDVYPFGNGAFSHNKEKNKLSIKGKIKGKSIDNPTLLSVVQVNRNTVTVTWDYNIDYISPVIKIQASLDGVNWTVVKAVNNVKTDTFSSAFFNDIMTGTPVYFKVVVSTADYSNKSSNTLNVSWQFNDWVLREISRTENINCGFSYLTLEIQGTVDLEFEWIFFSSPGGGSANVIDLIDGSNIVSFTSPYGWDYNESKSTMLSLTNETKQISIQLNNSNKTESEKILNCLGGNTEYPTSALLEIKIRESSTVDTVSKYLLADTIKRYFNRPTGPTGPIETIE